MTRHQKPITIQSIPAWAPASEKPPEIKKQLKRDRARGASILSVAEAASHLNVSEKTIRRLITAGTLQVLRIGRLIRIRPAEVERFLAEASHSTAAPVGEDKETGSG